MGTHLARYECVRHLQTCMVQPGTWKHKMCTRKKLKDWWLFQDTARNKPMSVSCKLALYGRLYLANKTQWAANVHLCDILFCLLKYPQTLALYLTVILKSYRKPEETEDLQWKKWEKNVHAMELTVTYCIVSVNR